MTRSIHLVRPGWQGDPDDMEQFAVDSLLHGPSYIEIALELWQLANDPDRVKTIEEILACAYDRENLELTTKEVKDLDTLLDGLDDAIKKLWLDDQEMIHPELLSEVRRRTKHLDVNEIPGHIPGAGISQGLSQVHELRHFLKLAVERGLHVALD